MDMYVDFYNREFRKYNDATKANEFAEREMELYDERESVKNQQAFYSRRY